MEWISARSIYIGVGIFVTLAIVSGVVLSFNKMGDIYGQVAKTEISIKDQFDNVYAMYNGAKLNGVDLLNTLKKYEDDKNVNVEYPEHKVVKNKAKDESKREVEILQELMEAKKTGFSYEKKYTATVKKENYKIKIIFE